MRGLEHLDEYVRRTGMWISAIPLLALWKRAGRESRTLRQFRRLGGLAA